MAAPTVAVITDTLPTDGSEKDFESTGFGTPDAAIIFISPSNSDNLDALSVGFYDGTNKYSQLVTEDSRATTSGRVGNDGIITYDVTGWSSNGITIDPVGTKTNASNCTVILIKGVSASLQLGVDQDSSVTGLGFDPNFVFAATIGAGSTNFDDSNGIFSLGVSRKDSSNNITNAAIFYHSNAHDTSVRNDACFGQLFNGSVSWANGVTSFDAGGVTLGSTTGSDVGALLLLELDDPDDSYIEVIATKGSTGADTAVTGVGFEPSFIGTIGAAFPESTTINTVDASSDYIFFGADDGTTKAAHVAAFEDAGVDEAYYTSSYSVLGRISSSNTQEGSISALGSDGFTYSYDTSSSAIRFVAFGFGDSNASAGTALTANDVESASSVDSPALGQVHALTAVDIESASEVDSPAIGQAHALSPTDIESASEVDSPALGTDTTDALTPTDVESASELDAPAITQAHALTAADVVALSEISAPALGGPGVDALSPTDVEAITEVDAPALTQVHALTALDLEALSSVSTPATTGDIDLALIYARVNEIWRILGLDSDNPLTVTPTSRVSGDISQTISGDGTTSTTVTRD